MSGGAGKKFLGEVAWPLVGLRLQWKCFYWLELWDGRVSVLTELKRNMWTRYSYTFFRFDWIMGVALQMQTVQPQPTSPSTGGGGQGRNE